MHAKLTLDDMKAHGKKNGYEVLSASIVNSTTPILVKWKKCGHKESKQPARLRGTKNKAGDGCGQCYWVDWGDIVTHSKRNKYTLLSKAFPGNRRPLSIRWSGCKHEDNKTWTALKAGQGCGPCHYVTIEKIAAIGKQRGFLVLSKHYKNSKTPILIRWEKCGHKEPKVWFRIKNFPRCSFCAPNKPLTLEDVKAHGKKNGYEVLSRRYSGSAIKLKIRWLRCGHKTQQIYNSLQQGVGCTDCFRTKKLTIEDVKAHGKKNGYEVLSRRYIGAKSPLQIRWDCGHSEPKPWNYIQNGIRCGVCYGGWSAKRIARVIRSLGPVLKNLDPCQRQIVLEQGRQLEGLDVKIQRAIVRGDFNDAVETESELLKLVESTLGKQSGELDDREPAEVDMAQVRRDVDELSGVKTSDAPEDSYEGLPLPDINKRLDVLDQKVSESKLTNPEAVEELVQLELDRVWNAALNDPSLAARFRRTQSKGFTKEVRERFAREYDEVARMSLPSGFAFRHKPTLMQRLTAYRVKTRKRYGNWSGMGSGKTGAAVLASRAIGAALTVVVCPNVLAESQGGDCQWAREVSRWFPNTQVVAKTWEPKWRGTSPRYLILNYEMFQQRRSLDAIAEFLNRHRVDFLVVDEVHFMKQRGDDASQRRQAIRTLIASAGEANPELHVLTMTGTPVINNLREGVSQVELVEGRDRVDLPTMATGMNCIKIKRALSRAGFRQRVRYDVVVQEKEIPIECGSVIEQLKEIGPNRPVEREEILTRLKLPAIVANLKKGEPTLIYTHYVGVEVDGARIVDMLVRACKKRGLSVGLCMGGDKSGTAPFMAGKLDVLIASSSIATGVDGLQDVCHKLIINVLPWTHAEYDQLIGRLYRKGQRKDVQVIIPVTTTQMKNKDGDFEERSWCRRVLSMLRYKKTVGDAATDGVWPGGELVTVETAWKRWQESLS